MKKIIFFMALLVSTTTQAQQRLTLTPDFYEQFKAILTAKEIYATGKSLGAWDNAGTISRYSSTYKLDGFTVEELLSKSGGFVSGSMVAAAKADPRKIDCDKLQSKLYCTSGMTWNEWMVREISFELPKLEQEGFTVIRSDNLFRIESITIRKKGSNLDIAKLFLNKDNSIEILFLRKEVGADAPVNNTKTGTTLIPFTADNGKYGFKDENGNIIVQPKYDYAADFSEGRAMVTLKKKYGYVDESGAEVIPLIYNYAGLSFQNGKAEVKLKGREFWIDKSGQEIKN